MKAIAILLTAMYLVLECITAVQSSSIFFETMTSDNLVKTEKLGYVTAGIGLGLLCCSLLKNKLRRIGYIPVFLLIAYTASNSIHSVIKNAPEYFTTDMNKSGVYYGVGLLNNPSPSWPAFAYGFMQGPASIPKQHVDTFVRNNGVSDLQSRQLLSSGIRGIGIFSKHWDLAQQKLDRQNLASQFDKLNRAIYESHFVNGTSRPGKLVMFNFPWSTSSIIHDGANVQLSRGVNWSVNEATWWELRRRFEFLPGSTPRKDLWLHTFNHSFTKTILSEYLSISDGQQMPWKGQPAYGDLYQQVCQQIAPYFFKDGVPVLSLAQLRNVSVRDMYITELKSGELSPKLKALVFDYQRDNLNQLINTSEAWENPVRSSSGYGLSRLIWLTPVLTMLSWGLLCLNAWNLVNQQLSAVDTELFRKIELTVAVVLSAYLAASLLLPSEIWQLYIREFLLLIGPSESNMRIV